MYNIDKLVKFLESIEDFYKAEEGKEKEGIGHETEHINGVMLRAAGYGRMVNENLLKYHQKSPVDMGILMTCAALHDIGNVIERDAHGQYGFAIVMGKLEINDFFKIPFKNGITDKFLSPSDIENLKLSIEFNGYNIAKNELDFFNPVVSYLTAKVFFELAYEKNEITSEIELRKYLQKFSKISKDVEDAVVEKMIKNGEVQVSYNPKLKQITASIQEIFGESSKELEMIAQAVQDHNIDYKNDMERYRSRSIYGMIISDADKDTVPEVFALRTIAYAANKLGIQKHKEFCLKDNPSQEEVDFWGTNFVPDVQQCSKHVLHQSWERFRESNDEYQMRTGISISQREFWREIAEYKDGLVGTKGIIGQATIKCPETKEALKKAINGRNFVIDSSHNLTTFMIVPNEGEDLYSELDDFSDSDDVRNFRKPFIDKVRLWGDPVKEMESIAEVYKLALEWKDAKSNEEIIGKYESNARRTLFGNIDYSFGNIVDLMLDDNFSGYREACSLDELIGTAQKIIPEVPDDGDKTPPSLDDIINDTK